MARSPASSRLVTIRTQERKKNMSNKTQQHIDVVVGGKTIRFEAGLLAQQAAGSVTCRLGDTVVFSAVTTGKSKREGIDFFPLQVEFREKTYAAGRFPGGYFKREARPSEKEILTARMTDRPIRPLFPDGFFDEVQINNAMLCADGENESDIPCINAASAALTLSELPFRGPVGAVRVGRVEGRECKIAWKARRDISHQDPSAFGTVALVREKQ